MKKPIRKKPAIAENAKSIHDFIWGDINRQHAEMWKPAKKKPAKKKDKA